ncbi:TonB-dependent receptor [Duncaniella muricolitica]|jgi:outer membrane receptor protein involved in Fe transport|uniref:TonB-dependent receptor n=1 Tax=Duncaniella muricolitica TaxID=2880704 RepID=UPI00244DE937|nr:TonB-dependent receptor [Duncaniella muricolitica]
MRIPTATITLLSLLLTFLSAEAAPADTPVTYAPADTAALQLGEVSVTSIKQSSSLLRQPVTVTTVSQGQIERFNIAGMKGVSEIAPNFFMPDYGSRMTSSIYVRGIGARIDQSAVGLNIDNIPYLNKNGFDFDMLDVERIEVLRGPQSTLYGRNTIAGLINVYTLSPMSWQGVRIMAEGSIPAAGRAGIGIYQKLAPRLAMSLNGYVSHTHGYFRNLHNGKRADASTDFSGRWKTHWRPTDRLSFENVLSAGHSRQSGYPYAYVETGDINYNDTCFYRRTSVTDGLTVRWAGPSVSIASITGLQFLSDNMTLDQDFLPESYFTLTQRQLDRSITQDIVVRGHKGGYSWLAGAFAFYKYGSMTAPVTFKEDGIENLILSNIRGNMPSFIQLDWADDNFLLGSDFRHHVSGAALYHQSTYDLGPWSFALNMRFDYEHTALSYRSNCATGAVGSVNLPQLPRPIPFTLSADIDEAGRLKQTFRQFLPKLSVTYNLRNSAVFLSVAKGYKSGGFNTQMFSDFLQQQMITQMKDQALDLMTGMMPGAGGSGSGSATRPADTSADTPQYTAADYVSYKPETSWNYELGGHFSCDEGRVYSTFSAFYIDVRDQQITVFPEGNSTGRMMTNAGRSRSFGAELTLRYTPTDRWRFDLSYGYTNARFRRFIDAGKDLAGNRIPYAPSNTLFLAASYRLPLHGTFIDAISFSPTLRGTGSIYWDEENLYRQPFYAELGASVRFHHSHFTLDLWGKNLTDTRFDVFRYSSVGHDFLQRGKPLRGGVTLRLNL